MKFRRKAEATDTADETASDRDRRGRRDADTPHSGPFDVSQVEGDGIDRADLGSVLVPADRRPRAAAPGRRAVRPRARR